MTVGATLQPEPFLRLIRHALDYKYWLTFAALIGFGLTGLGLCFTTPVYQAEAVVIVDSRRNKLADDESALSSIVLDEHQSALRSELDLLTSPDLARHVITSLDLLHTHEYRTAFEHVSAATRFEGWRDQLTAVVERALIKIGWKNLQPGSDSATSVLSPALVAAARHPDASWSDGMLQNDAVMQTAVKIFGASFWAINEAKSLTIRLGYRSPSPVIAAAVTNAALRRYLAADEELKAAAAKRASVWLTERIAGLRADLRMAEQAVEDFRASHNLATNRDQSPLEQQLLQLKSRQVDAQAELASAQAKVLAARQSDGAALRVETDVLSSRLIQALREQEATLLAQQAQLSAQLGDRHPSMMKVAEQLARVRGALQAEIGRIGQSNGTDVEVAEMRLAALAGEIRVVQAKIDEANAAQITLRSLEADAAAKRTVLNTFSQRYDQTAGTPLTPPDSRVASWATVPVDAEWPKYKLMLAAGTLGFTGVAFGLSLLNERLRRGFRGPGELEEELGLVVAGLTPRLPRRRRKLAVAETAPMRQLALTVRALAHTPGPDHVCRVVLVTSSIGGEGKSTVALSLARSAASGGQRCLLIDADISNPSLHTNLGVPATPGFVELTVDKLPLETVTRQTAGEKFCFLSAGRPTADALTPFTVDAFRTVLVELKSRYDVIVVDSAPVLLTSEAVVLAGFADLTLFVVEWRATPRQLARKAAALLTRVAAGPCLAVLSKVDTRRGGDASAGPYRGAYQSA